MRLNLGSVSWGSCRVCHHALWAWQRKTVVAYNDYEQSWRAVVHQRCVRGAISLLFERLGISEDGLERVSVFDRELEDEHVRTLIELATADREQDFWDLAAMLGVSPERRKALWAGTRARIAGRRQDREDAHVTQG